MNRRTAREKALQALFQMDMSDIGRDEALENVLDGSSKTEFFTDLVVGVDDHRDEIDQLISSNLENWTLKRLANVDRNILRIATYELKYRDDIPKNVTINEAIEIAKIFSDEESSRFVNGILSKIKMTLEKNN